MLISEKISNIDSGFRLVESGVQCGLQPLQVSDSK
jgi:hypothetical protein